MGTRGRVWRVGKWVATAIAVVLAAIAGISVVYDVGYVSGELTTIYAGSATIRVVRLIGTPDEMAFVASMVANKMGPSGARAGWHVERRSRVGIDEYWDALKSSVSRPRVFPLQDTLFSYRQRGGIRTQRIDVPLGLPIAAFGMIAAFMWYCDRRRIPAGRCQRCGYDLTKNESGRCPECGVVIS